jgi:tetratricopeptide (TPR) repeat protein
MKLILKDISCSIKFFMNYFSGTFFCLLILSAMSEMAFGQTAGKLQQADSFYANHEWSSAKGEFIRFLRNDSSNSMVWNKLGFCNQHLGLYQEASEDYKMTLKANPPILVKNIAMVRMSMAYSLLNKPAEAADWLLKATTAGYNSLNDLDSLDAFKNLRGSSNFLQIRQKAYEILYPCSKEPRNRDFDFWIGD